MATCSLCAPTRTSTMIGPRVDAPEPLSMPNTQLTYATFGDKAPEALDELISSVDIIGRSCQSHVEGHTGVRTRQWQKPQQVDIDVVVSVRMAQLKDHLDVRLAQQDSVMQRLENALAHHRVYWESLSRAPPLRPLRARTASDVAGWEDRKDSGLALSSESALIGNYGSKDEKDSLIGSVLPDVKKTAFSSESALIIGNYGSKDESASLIGSVLPDVKRSDSPKLNSKRVCSETSESASRNAMPVDHALSLRTKSVPSVVPRSRGNTSHSIITEGRTSSTASLFSHRHGLMRSFKSILSNEVRKSNTKPLVRFSTYSQHELNRRLRASDIGAKATMTAQMEALSSELLRESGYQAALIRFIEGTPFSIAIALAIMSNCIFVGFQVELGKGNNRTSASSIAFYSLEIVYCIIFVFELSCRGMALGIRDFLLGPDWHWNGMDAILVLGALFDVAVAPVFGEKSPDLNLSMLRIYRVARMAKALRMMRVVRFLRPLRIMVASVVNTLRSLIWALFLLVLIIYMFGVVFTQAANDPTLELDRIQTHQVQQFYGNLGKSIYSLFKAMTGGVDWGEAALPLAHISGVYVSGFIAFIAFICFAVMNVVTAYFCQHALETAQHDQDNLMGQAIKERLRCTEVLHDLFDSMDRFNKGSINLADFDTMIEEEFNNLSFESLGLDVSDSWTLFKLLDREKANSIGRQQFVLGCLRLRGAAKSVDLHSLGYDLRWLTKMVSHLSHILGEIQSSSASTELFHASLHKVQEEPDFARSVRGSESEPWCSKPVETGQKSLRICGSHESIPMDNVSTQD